MSEREKRFSGPICITGGAGFIGSHLIEKITKKHPDNRVISVDNYSTGTSKNHIELPNVEYVEGHTKDIVELWDDVGLPDPSIVFHFGEYPRIYQSFGDIEEVVESNMRGSFEVINWASKKEAFLLYAATSSASGNEGRDRNLTPYSWTKANNVDLIKRMSEWFPYSENDPRKKLEYAITYFFNVYGPRHIRDGKGATVIGIWERQFLAGEPLGVVLPGTQTRDFTHVEDIVDGVIKVAERGKGDNYQLGYGEQRSIVEVARMFGTDIKMLPERKGDRKSGQASASKAQGLGWRAKIDIKDYIGDFVESNSTAFSIPTRRKTPVLETVG
jgi:UDP-glucose 4-epimerase